MQRASGGNAVRSFYGGLLQREIEPLLHQIKRPRRPARAPRLYSMAEVEKLLTVGTEGKQRARVKSRHIPNRSAARAAYLAFLLAFSL